MLGAQGHLSRRGMKQLFCYGIGRSGRKNASSGFVVSSVDCYHVWSSIRKEEDEKKRLRCSAQLGPCSSTYMTTTRGFHTTPVPNRGASVALILGSVALTAKAGQYAVEAFEDWKKSQPSPEEVQGQAKENQSRTASAGDETAKAKAKTDSTSSSASGKKRENFFAKFFNLSVGSKYYEGGFEDKMTKREAALILGVRESSTSKRIKEAHRKLLILNHPDTGGSTYLAGKLNEAKELLLKNKQ